MTGGVPIPRRMAHLPRDKRGYPIPANVLIDSAGEPHFTINDTDAQARMLRRDQCPICGRLLARRRWFIGGPLSAFHPRGVYIDLPSHDECAHYALAVCPYLAAPNYARRIDGKTLTAEGAKGIGVMVDWTMNPDRPPVFVAVEASRTIECDPYVAPARPFLRVEYWRHGQRIDDAEGEAITAEAMRHAPQPQPPAARFVQAGGKR